MIMVRLLSTRAFMVGFGTTEFTRAWEPALLWNQLRLLMGLSGFALTQPWSPSAIMCSCRVLFHPPCAASLVSVVLDAVLQEFSVLPFIGAFPKCMIAVHPAVSTSIASRDIFSVPCTSVTALASPSSLFLAARSGP